MKKGFFKNLKWCLLLFGILLFIPSMSANAMPQVSASDGVNESITIDGDNDVAAGKVTFEVYKSDDITTMEGAATWTNNALEAIAGSIKNASDYRDIVVVVADPDTTSLSETAGIQLKVSQSVMDTFAQGNKSLTIIVGPVTYTDITKHTGDLGDTILGFKENTALADELHFDFYDSGFAFSYEETRNGEEGHYLFQEVSSAMARSLAHSTGNPVAGNVEIQNESGNLKRVIFNQVKVEAPGLHAVLFSHPTEGTDLRIPASATGDDVNQAFKLLAWTMSGTLKLRFENTGTIIIAADSINGLNYGGKSGNLIMLHNNVVYEISSITSPDEDMTLGSSVVTDTVRQQLGDQVKYAISFVHSGKLPGPVKITAAVSDVPDGTYTISYLNDTGNLTEDQSVTVKDGTVTFTITHCSAYVLHAVNTTNVPQNTQQSTQQSTEITGTLDEVPKTGDAMGNLVFIFTITGILSGIGFVLVHKKAYK